MFVVLIAVTNKYNVIKTNKIRDNETTDPTILVPLSTVVNTGAKKQKQNHSIKNRPLHHKHSINKPWCGLL